tara:strand:- start:15017 stop:15307 length:291 start_codon:yes stop_codon:yes gene_type:complete
MTIKQEEKIKVLLSKYNEILLVSMRLAIAEDFTNLIILNKDDTDFELSELLQNKDQFTNHIMKEFLRQNSSVVTKELSSMKEKKLAIIKQTKLKFK